MSARLAFPLQGIPRAGQEIEFRLAQPLGNMAAGSVIKLAVMPEDVSTQQARDSYFQGYKKTNSGVDKIVAPIASVTLRTGKLWGQSIENMRLVPETRISSQGAMSEVSPSFNSGQYTVADYGLMTYVAWDAVNDADPAFQRVGGLSQMHLDFLAEALMRARTKRVLDTVTTLANWSSSCRLSVGSTRKWDNGASRDIIGDLRTYVNAALETPTHILMNPTVATVMLSDSAVNTFLSAQFGSSNARPDDIQQAMTITQQLQRFRIPTFAQEFVIVPDKYMTAPGSAQSYMLADDVIGICNQGGVEASPDGVNTAISYRYAGRSGTGVQNDLWMPHGRGPNGGEFHSSAYSEDVRMSTGHDADGVATGCVAGFCLKGVLA